MLIIFLSDTIFRRGRKIFVKRRHKFMKTVKRIVAVLLAVMLMAPAAVNAASPSVAKKTINNKKATATTTYNAKMQTPKTVKIGGKKLVVGKDCVIVGKKHKASGKYVLVVKGIGNYSGKTEVVFVIKKAKQKIKTAVEQKTYKASSLKKKGSKFNLKTKAISSKVTYTVSTIKGTKNAKKYIKVSKSGKVTVKKGLKKGAYRIVIKAKATKNHKAAKKIVRVVIK